MLSKIKYRNDAHYAEKTFIIYTSNKFVTVEREYKPYFNLTGWDVLIH